MLCDHIASKFTVTLRALKDFLVKNCCTLLTELEISCNFNFLSLRYLSFFPNICFRPLKDLKQISICHVYPNGKMAHSSNVQTERKMNDQC